MNIRDILWLSYKDLSEKKVRTALTVIMVVIGVASIIALTSLTAGIGASISSALSSLGPTSIIVTSTKTTGFTIADTGEVSSLPNVSTIIPILTGAATLYSGNQNISVSVIGITSQGLQSLLGTINLYQGAVYNNTIAPSSLIGHSVAFPNSAAGAQSVFIGQPATLKLSGRTGSSYSIPVVGILQPYGTSLISIDSAVVMSLPAAEAILHKSSFNEMLVKANNISSVTALSTQISDIYGSGARVLTTQQLAQETSSIVGGITILLLLIASISLLVAAIGIMNIMLMAVLEKTREIGIMKSIGFKSNDVLMVFLVQAVLIGIIGGIIGILVGAAASYGLAAVASSSSAPSNSTVGPAPPSGSTFRAGGGAAFSRSTSPGSSFSFSPLLTVTTVAEAILVAVIVSVIAGIYPAWRASKMQPIDALRQL
jgi:ABC-type antimicrobial peptide transport system permease subunit